MIRRLKPCLRSFPAPSGALKDHQQDIGDQTSMLVAAAWLDYISNMAFDILPNDFPRQYMFG